MAGPTQNNINKVRLNTRRNKLKAMLNKNGNYVQGYSGSVLENENKASAAALAAAAPGRKAQSNLESIDALARSYISELKYKWFNAHPEAEFTYEAPDPPNSVYELAKKLAKAVVNGNPTEKRRYEFTFYKIKLGDPSTYPPGSTTNTPANTHSNEYYRLLGTTPGKAPANWTFNRKKYNQENALHPKTNFLATQPSLGTVPYGSMGPEGQRAQNAQNAKKLTRSVGSRSVFGPAHARKNRKSRKNRR
jgi:hypothetical protein